MIALLAAWLIASPADAGAGTVSAAVGRDFATNQFFTGLDAAWRTDGNTSWTPFGRLTGAWALADDRPIVFAEGGVTYALPRDGETVRIGLVLTAAVFSAPYRMPIAFSDKAGAHLGLIPGMEFLTEFEFGEEHPFVFGARAGLRSAYANHMCAVPDEMEDCLVWYGAFTGGFYGRGALFGALYIELLIGPSPLLTIGYQF